MTIYVGVLGEQETHADPAALYETHPPMILLLYRHFWLGEEFVDTNVLPFSHEEHRDVDWR